MKHLTTTILALSLLTGATAATANELSIKTGYISVFTKGDAPNKSQAILAASFEAQLGGVSIIAEGGTTYGSTSLFISKTPTANGDLADYSEDEEHFQFMNLRMLFKTKLQEKDLTLSIGPSLVTYESTLYTVNAPHDGYNPSTSRQFHFGLTTEVTLNLLQTKALGIDIYMSPINYHPEFGAAFSFGATLGVNI
ncbi:MAG: hypothetical protein HRU38_12970 [Saccharospirillaceae bacterium]|nr:hypothetical protein [Saccharospirillaceae bacterium]